MEGVTCCLLAAHSPVRREGHTLRRGPSGKKGASTGDVGDPWPVQLAGDATGGDSTATEAEGVRGHSRPNRLSCRPMGPSASSAGARTREGPSRRGPRDVSEDVAPAAAPPAGPGEGRAGRHSRCSTRNGKAAPGQTRAPKGDTGAAGPHGLGRPRGALTPLGSAPAWGQQPLYAFVSLSKRGVCSGLSHRAPAARSPVHRWRRAFPGADRAERLTWTCVRAFTWGLGLLS